MFRLIVLSLCFSGLLTACGNETSEDILDNMPLYAMDTIINAEVGKNTEVDMAKYIIGDIKQARITRITSSDKHCPTPTFDGLLVSIPSNQMALCSFDYYVTSSSSNGLSGSSNATLLVMSADNNISSLPTIVKNLSLADDPEVDIDLKQELGASYPNNYALQSEVVLLGGGQVYADVDTDIISYHAVDLGIVRLVYSLIDETSADIIYGIIEIGISGGEHIPPEAKNFTFNIAHDENERIIDVSEFVSSSIPNATLQLIGVRSVNLTTYPHQPRRYNQLIIHRCS